MSRRQLHGIERGAEGNAALAGTSALIRDINDRWSSARSCEMEALDQLQHRAKAKLRKAVRAWVSAPSSVTPHIQSWLCGTGDGVVGSSVHLTRGELSGSAQAVGGEEETTTRRCRWEQSDHLVVALKPGNAGGAKGVTGRENRDRGNCSFCSPTARKGSNSPGGPTYRLMKRTQCSKEGTSNDWNRSCRHELGQEWKRDHGSRTEAQRESCWISHRTLPTRVPFLTRCSERRPNWEPLPEEPDVRSTSPVL